MKTCNTIIILCLISIFAHAQFQTCNSPTTVSLKDVYFIDADIGIAVGNLGVIVRSINGGLDWNVVMEADSIEFTKVKFFDEQNGIAIGTHIYITDDAGQTWTNIPYSIYKFWDVEILNETTCLLTGQPTALMRSEDMGQTWTVIMQEQTEFYDYGLLSFLDEDTGYTCRYGGTSPPTRTLKTQDGGNTWITIETLSQTSTVMEAMSFTSEDVGFKAGWYNPHFQKTTNGGLDWMDVNSTSSFFDMMLIDIHIEPDQSSSYYACGWGSVIYKSTDNGDTWFELNSGLTNTFNLNGIYFLNETTGWVVGDNGTILKTTTGGTVGLSDPEQPLPVKVYPNPSTGIIQIDNMGNDRIERIELLSSTGQLIEIFADEKSVNIQHLPAGEYLLRMLSDSRMHTEKIVKQ